MAFAVRNSLFFLTQNFLSTLGFLESSTGNLKSYVQAMRLISFEEANVMFKTVHLHHYRAFFKVQIKILSLCRKK